MLCELDDHAEIEMLSNPNLKVSIWQHPVTNYTVMHMKNVKNIVTEKNNLNKVYYSSYVWSILLCFLGFTSKTYENKHFTISEIII